MMRENALPHPIHFFFNHAGSCQMEGIIHLYNYISAYLIGILFFVSMALYIVNLFQIDGSRHIWEYITEERPEFLTWLRYVRDWTHSTPLELIWTIIPTTILVVIASPSFVLLYSLDEIVDCDAVVKIIAYQWYWKYEYPVFLGEDLDILNVSVYSYMVPQDNLTKYMPNRLLEVDMPLILPHSVNVKLIITSKDVLHSFAIPALGIKMDAVPGRLNQVTVFITQPGIYYGQCSELCGVNHAFMPIVIHAISPQSYDQFLLDIALAQEKEAIFKIAKKINFRFTLDFYLNITQEDIDGMKKSYLLAQQITGEECIDCMEGLHIFEKILAARERGEPYTYETLMELLGEELIDKKKSKPEPKTEEEIKSAICIDCIKSDNTTNEQITSELEIFIESLRSDNTYNEKIKDALAIYMEAIKSDVPTDKQINPKDNLTTTE